MKRASIAFVVVAFLGSFAALAVDFTEVANSASPSGQFAARTEPPTDTDDRDFLCLYRKGSGEVIARLPLGGYARYPMDADPANLQLLWAPDSKHFALTIRDTKRSWTATVYAMEAKGVRSLKLPSATAKALELLSSSEVDRMSREAPAKWIDNGHLLLRASGDTTIDRELIWYEVDLTYSLESGKITDSKVVAKKPHGQ